MRLLLRAAEYLTLPRQRLQPEPRPGGGVPHHPVQGAHAGTAQYPANLPGDLRPAARHRPGDRADGFGQVHDARGHDQLHQRVAPRAYPHHRGSDRVRAHEQELPDQPTRDRQGHTRLQQRLALRAARGSGHDPGGRDARPRDHPPGADRRRDRPPGVRHAAHELGRQDHRPHHRRVPGGGEGDGARHALGVAARGDRAGAAEEARRRAYSGVRDHDRHVRHPQSHPREQGAADVLRHPDRPERRHADPRPGPHGAAALAPGHPGRGARGGRQQGPVPGHAPGQRLGVKRY